MFQKFKEAIDVEGDTERLKDFRVSVTGIRNAELSLKMNVHYKLQGQFFQFSIFIYLIKFMRKFLKYLIQRLGGYG